MDNHFRLRMAAGMLLVMGVMAAGMAASAVGLTSNGVAVSHFATGFPTAKSGTGPTGVAFDLSQNMFVSDAGFIYRFDQNGGRADLHRLSRTSISGILAGLAFSRSGQLYAAR